MHSTGVTGSNGGWTSEFTCPKGQFVVGLDSWAGDAVNFGHDVIKGVQVVCRNLTSPVLKLSPYTR